MIARTMNRSRSCPPLPSSPPLASVRATLALYSFLLGQRALLNQPGSPSRVFPNRKANCCVFQPELFSDVRDRMEHDMRIGKKYQLRRQIGSGSFGDIYLGVNVISGEEVAVKLESVKARHPQLDYEARVYKALSGGIGIPFVRWYGTERDYNALVIDLLGPSLEDLFNFCNRRFSYKTTLLLADQLVCRLEFIHSRGFIHRDIKPDNFLMGIGRRGNQVNVIDFGLAKRFRDPQTHRHIPYREHKNLTGTARYASLNTHLGVEQSRRDDLESLAYVLIYFARGGLPWQGLRAQTKRQKYTRIMECKLHTDIDTLTRGLPAEFNTFLRYARELRFDDRPDYVYFRRILRDLFVRQGYHYDYVFDWKFVAKRTRSGQPASLKDDLDKMQQIEDQIKPDQSRPGDGQEHYYKEPDTKGQTPVQAAGQPVGQPVGQSLGQMNVSMGGQQIGQMGGQMPMPVGRMHRVPVAASPQPMQQNPGSPGMAPPSVPSISPVQAHAKLGSSGAGTPNSRQPQSTFTGAPISPSPVVSPMPSYNPYQQPSQAPPLPNQYVGMMTPTMPVTQTYTGGTGNSGLEYKTEVLPKVVPDPLDPTRIYYNGQQFNVDQELKLLPRQPTSPVVRHQLVTENASAVIPNIPLLPQDLAELDNRIRRIAIYQYMSLRTMLNFNWGPYARYEVFQNNIERALSAGFLLPLALPSRFEAYELAYLRSNESGRGRKLLDMMWNRERFTVGGCSLEEYQQCLAVTGWSDSPLRDDEIEVSKKMSVLCVPASQPKSRPQPPQNYAPNNTMWW